MKLLYINSIEQINNVAKDFLTIIKGNKKIAFYGEMGAGKTTFVRAICNELKVTDLVTSPTFSIVNQYNTHTGQVIYHFDFYRIKLLTEIYDLGFEDYYYSDSYCFIEWPEIAESLYNNEILKVHMKEIENQIREITINL